MVRSGVGPAPHGGRHTPPQARVSTPSAEGLSRDRLLRALDPLCDGGVGLVVAPAGCGKTTLMAEWARRFPGTVAWYRARPDDLPQRLVDHLAVAVGMPGSDHLRDVDEVARALEHRRQPRLLVVDDVHALPDRTSHAVLETLLMEVPSGTCVVLGSRRMPDLDLAHGEMPIAPVQLGAEDLRFRSWEVESLFRDVYRAPLLPEDAAALARHTEGWAAALHLFHLSTAHSPPEARRQAIAELARRNRYARGYLSRQVLAGLGPTLSTFMRRTAVFATVTGARCDALLETTGSQALLEDLVARQALTTTDDGGCTFRYHEVLRRHLEADLESELGTAGLRDWYGRAARLLEEDGAVLEALRVRARAQDWAGARALLVTSGHQIASRSGSWPGLLPNALVREDPWVALAEAYRLLGDGRLAAAEQTARHAMDSLDDQRGHDRARDLLAVTRAWQHLETTPSERWYELVAAGLREIPDPSRAPHPSREATAAMVRPFLTLLRGDVDEAAAGLAAARAAAAGHPSLLLSVELLDAVLAVLLRRPDARHVAEVVAVQAELADLEWFARIARALIALSDDDPRRRQEELGRVAALCQRREDAWGVALVIGLDAAVQAIDALSDATGPVPAAPREALARAAATTRSLGATVLTAWAMSLDSLLAARRGDPDARDTSAAALALARGCGALGAQAMATGASALVTNSPGLRRSADLLADDVHLRARPWQQGVTARSPATGTPATGSMADGALLEVAATRFRLLGGFGMEQDGSPVGLDTLRPQHRLLLRMLTLHADEMLHREHLVEELWPHQAADTAQHRLQTAVWALRRLLDEAAAGCGCTVVRDGPRYGLVLGVHCTTDVRELHQWLALARSAGTGHDTHQEIQALRAAVELYRGELLPDDGAVDWVVEERDRIRAVVSRAATTLAARLAPVDARASLEAAKHALSIDTYNDEAWRLVIAGHTELGDLALAERARLTYREVLADLGVDAEPAPQPRV